MIFINMNDYKLPDICFKTKAILSEFGVVGTVVRTEFWNLHAFTEASRVKTFQEVCQKDMEASVALSELGELMGQSHESLRNLYECSHPNLDKLVQLGKGKALGSRLTGAGWVIHLTTRQPASWLIGCGSVPHKFPTPFGWNCYNQILFSRWKIIISFLRSLTLFLLAIDSMLGLVQI